MRLQEIFYVLSDDRRQFFDLEGNHIEKTHAHAFWIAKMSLAHRKSNDAFELNGRCRFSLDPRASQPKSLGFHPC